MSDLNLVDGLLVFFLSGLEQTFGIINHLFQTVLLRKRKKEQKKYGREIVSGW